LDDHIYIPANLVELEHCILQNQIELHVAKLAIILIKFCAMPKCHLHIIFCFSLYDVWSLEWLIHLGFVWIREGIWERKFEFIWDESVYAWIKRKIVKNEEKVYESL